MRYIKDLILNAIRATGYKITHITNKSKYYRKWSILQNEELEVSTLIDIGVGYGTDELYHNATFDYLVLIEPLGVYASKIHDILNVINGEWCRTAVSDYEGSTSMTYYREFPEKTSFNKRIKEFERKGDKEKITVPVTTVDNIIQNTSINKPVGIKIDAEGNELSILKGSKGILRYTKYVVVEAPIVERFKNGYSMDELTSFMNKNDFYIRNIVDMDDGKIVKFADFLFYNRQYD